MWSHKDEIVNLLMYVVTQTREVNLKVNLHSYVVTQARNGKLLM